MRATVRSMTLQTLLRQHGITAITELQHRTGSSRQQSWNLWHAQVGVGEATGKGLHEQPGIPAEQLLQVDPAPATKPPHTILPSPSWPAPESAAEPLIDPAKGEGMNTPDYEADFYTWTQQQAAALRSKDWPVLDVANLAEEIESLGKEQAHAVESHLVIVLTHLLKWRYQPEGRSRGWRTSVRVAGSRSPGACGATPACDPTSRRP